MHSVPSKTLSVIRKDGLGQFYFQYMQFVRASRAKMLSYHMTEKNIGHTVFLLMWRKIIKLIVFIVRQPANYDPHASLLY